MSATTAPTIPDGSPVFIEAGIYMHADSGCADITGPVEAGTYPARSGFVCHCCDDAFDLDMRFGSWEIRTETPAPDRTSNPTATGSKAPAPKVIAAALPLPDEVDALVNSLGRKFVVEDMTTGLIEFAAAWLADYAGTFEFLLDVRSKVNASGRSLSAGQAKGVLNCYRADVLRSAKAAKVPAPESTLDLSELPAGRYAVPGSDGRLKIKIDKPTKGNWDGFVFVKDAAEYGQGNRYGRQAPGGTYQGDLVDELRIIAADPVAAMAAYGHLVGKCGACGRHLEDEESIERGIGPVCLAKMS